MSRYQCPCGAKYRFEPEHAGKRAKCKRCGEAFVVPGEEGEAGVIPLADEPIGLMDEVAAAASRVPPAAASRPPSVPGTAPGPGPVRAAPRPVAPDLPEVPVGGGFAASVVQTLLFPSSIENLITFVIVWLMLLASALILPFAPCIGFIGQLIIFGWYCAFRLNIIVGAAEGKSDLPGMTLTGGLFDDAIVPFFQWVGSWLLVLGPAVVYLAFSMVNAAAGSFQPAAQSAAGGMGAVLADLQESAPAFLVLFGLGLFFWPIVALCISIGGFATLGRPDLIVGTIVRTFPVYLIVVGLVFSTVAASYFSELALQPAPGKTATFSDTMVQQVCLIGLGLYLEIVAMRVIGLYYHHYKRRFAWDWE